VTSIRAPGLAFLNTVITESRANFKSDAAAIKIASECCPLKNVVVITKSNRNMIFFMLAPNF
jgi:hypothetical protein